ncbi:MAG TPA: hypothetical protein VHL50_00450 [Pyrinomonadaceae bacterium]|nr:hypothetical protein [Pyrinomonadaceae bacterium]
MNKIQQDESCVLTIENRKDYLFIRVDGERDNAEITTRMWKQVASICRQTGQTNVMLVEAIEENIDLAEAYDTVWDRRLDEFAHLKIAFVDLVEDHHEVNEFVNGCTRNRGLNIRLFRSIQAAEKWLSMA